MWWQSRTLDRAGSESRIDQGPCRETSPFGLQKAGIPNAPGSVRSILMRIRCLGARQPKSKPPSVLSESIVSRPWVPTQTPDAVAHPVLTLGVAEEQARHQRRGLPTLLGGDGCEYIAMSCRTRWDRTDVDPNGYAFDWVEIVNEDLVDGLFGRIADEDRWDRGSVVVGIRRVQIPLAPNRDSAGLLAALFPTQLTTIRLTLP